MFKDKSELNSFLEKNSASFRYIEPTQENWDKEFPGNKLKIFDEDASFKNNLKIEGRKGVFTSFEKLIEKGKIDERHLLMGLIKPTLQNPSIVVRKKNVLIFIKSFKHENGRVDYNSIAYEKGDLLEIVSNYRRDKLQKLYERVSDGEVLVFLASSSEKTGFSSRGTSHAQPEGLTNPTKLKQSIENYNETWSKTFFKNGNNSIETNKISYKAYGFEITTIRNGASKIFVKDYSELDNFREGVLL